jgi:hypothetical protein
VSAYQGSIGNGAMAPWIIGNEAMVKGIGNEAMITVKALSE